MSLKIHPFVLPHKLYFMFDRTRSVVEPEPPLLAGTVKKGAALAPALQLKLQLHMTPCLKKSYNKNVNKNVN